MQYGDLSNERGLGVVIHADLLFEIRRKYFGLVNKVRFIPETRRIIEKWFMVGNLSIYIVLSGDYIKHKKDIERRLDDFWVLYSRLIEVDSPEELEFVIEPRFILSYFYKENGLASGRVSSYKKEKVGNLNEANEILLGGV